MISFAEFEIAVLGLLRLARFDAGFAGFFDLSRDGARRSFRLALPLLPVTLLMLNLNVDWPAGTDPVRIGVSELIWYTISWIAFPLLLLSSAKLLDRGPKIYGAVAIYNWLSVLYVSLQLPIEIATYYGLDAHVSDALGLIVLLFVNACEFFAFRRILAVGIEIAIFLVLVDFVLGRIISSLVLAMAVQPLF